MPETYKWVECPIFTLFYYIFLVLLASVFLKPLCCQSDNQENRRIAPAKCVCPALPYHVSEENYLSKDRNAILLEQIALTPNISWDFCAFSSV